MSIDAQPTETATTDILVNSPSLEELAVALIIFTALFTCLAFMRKWEDVELKIIDIVWLAFASLALITQVSNLRVLNSEIDLKLAEWNVKNAVISYRHTVNSTENLSCHSVNEEDKPLCTRIASLAPIASKSNFPNNIGLVKVLIDLDKNPQTIKDPNLKVKVEEIKSARNRLYNRTNDLYQWKKARQLTATEETYTNFAPWLFVLALSLRLAKAFREVSLAKSKRNSNTPTHDSEVNVGDIQTPIQTTGELADSCNKEVQAKKADKPTQDKEPQ
ncbi:hypothetical protein [Vibrio vulnificus]|uniref:hypothetical protein n=1 Tax=Vibrio vulnificus TaxID=672 RepID=UPI00356A983B